MGAMRVGRTCRVRRRSSAGCGESRAHITSPERQSSSRFSGLVFARCGGSACSASQADGRNLEALQLAHDLQHAVRAMQLRAGRDMLPAERNWWNCAAVTGSISRRRRPSVRR